MTLVTGSWLLDATLLLLPFLYWYSTRRYGFWKSLGVPSMKPKLLVGNIGGVVMGSQHMGDPIYDCYRLAGEKRFMGLFAFDQPLLMIKDPELVATVLNTDFSAFYSRNARFDSKIDRSTSLTLFGMNGSKWKDLRSKLTPVFTSGKLKRMFPLVDAIGRELARFLRDEADKGSEVDVREMMSRFTTDVVCSVFVGFDCGSLRDGNTPFREHLRRLLREDVVGRIIQAMVFLAPKLLVLLGIKVESTTDVQYVQQSTVQLMEERKEKGITRGDIVDMLMRIRDEQLSDDEDESPQDTKKKAGDNQESLKFDNEMVVAQIVSFLAAGFETTSVTLSYALYELALNQQLQERTRQHVRQVLSKHEGKLTYEALHEMTQLSDLISETLRVYPPVSFLDRRTTRAYQIPGTDVVLPEGTGIVISVKGLHTDPRYWSEPFRFIPDRFSDESSKNRPSFTYLPFGEGPRTCIGMRLAHIKIKVGLTHILNNFNVSPTSKTPIPVPIDTGKFLSQPKGDITLKFTKLSPQ